MGQVAAAGILFISAPARSATARRRDVVDDDDDAATGWITWIQFNTSSRTAEPICRSSILTARLRINLKVIRASPPNCSSLQYC